ncbi:DNA helicase [Tanacetum coccineum]
MAQYPELTPADRADVVCRVFEQKVKDFLTFLKEVKTFGDVSAVLYTIEFKKRGLPHCHTLLWVDSKNEMQNAQQIDNYISTKIPDSVQDPRGYKLVTGLMMHEPCGAVSPSAACMQEGPCGPDHILAKISNSDESTTTIGNRPHIDEIQNYINGRFICPYEDCWRIFDFPIHSREPAVQILNVHLENMQRVNFHESDRLDIIRRQVRTKKSLGRLTYVHPSLDDLFYFRMLLCHRKGCKSPVEVHTVNRQILPTYRTACKALGLLADPLKLWIKYWEAMGDDIPEKISRKTKIPNYHVNTEELQGYILYELEKILNAFGKSVTEFGLQPPPQHLLKDLQNKLLMEEKNYKRGTLIRLRSRWYWETFLWRTIISSLRSHGKIVLAVASSGIASLLLLAGSTTHSRFKLPLELTDKSLCRAKKKSQLGNLLVETDLIIWDEAPMNDKLYFETLNRTLRDIISAPNVVFGGKTVALGGDFRQTQPVKKGASKEELIAASITKSHLWPYFKVCMLKENTRLLRSGLTSEQQRRSEQFAKWLLDVGNGEIGEPDAENEQDSSWVTILPEYTVTADEAGMSELIDFIYDDTTLKAPTAGSL